MRREKVKINQAPQTGEIDNLSHDGKGVARIDGKATFIQGALPGEIVEFQYIRVKKDFDEGKLLNVTKSSPLRVEPKCPHFQLCGGCSLQHLEEKEQIRFKEQHLLDLLSRYGRTQPASVLPALTSSPWNYRNKARLSTRFVEKKQIAMVGFRERNNPRYITEINQCPILNSKVDKDIPHLRGLINAMEDKHCIAQIELAAGDEEVALIFRNLSSLSKNDELLLLQFGASRNYKIFLQPSGPESVYCIYPSKAEDYLAYKLPDYGITFQFHPNDFTQVNSEINRKMVKQALELMALKHSDNVLDLFCGLGNFSLPMAKKCSMVVGVEGSKTMVDRAYMNASVNQIQNVEFYPANLDDPNEVRSVVKQSYDKVLLDPPRSGALEIVNHMDSINPERIVYVSCNPITLARDTDVLVNQKGYQLISAGVMDMFPHTAHVESIALFQKG